MNDDLAAFYAARLDEKETAARVAGGRGAGGFVWVAVDPVLRPGLISTVSGDVAVYSEGSPSAREDVRIARHDLARVLREVEAGRALLARIEEARDDSDTDALAALLYVARHFAAVYSDHPDYGEAWKP